MGPIDLGLQGDNHHKINLIEGRSLPLNEVYAMNGNSQLLVSNELVEFEK